MSTHRLESQRARTGTQIHIVGIRRHIGCVKVATDWQGVQESHVHNIGTIDTHILNTMARHVRLTVFLGGLNSQWIKDQHTCHTAGHGMPGKAPKGCAEVIPIPFPQPG